MHIIFILIILNTFTYVVMCLDKIKSLYKWWRISEKTLWILALFGGVFGIWLAMSYPVYHKAGKQKFKILIPLIGLIWISIILTIEYLF